MVTKELRVDLGPRMEIVTTAEQLLKTALPTYDPDLPTKLADVKIVRHDSGPIQVKMEMDNDEDAIKKILAMDRYVRKKELPSHIENASKVDKKRCVELTFKGQPIPQYDEGIVPDYLQLLIEREPTRTPQDLVDENVVCAMKVTIPAIKTAVHEMARFLAKYERLPPSHRLYFTIDKEGQMQLKQRPGHLPALFQEGKFFVLGVPQPARPVKNKYVDYNYVKSRFANLAALHEKGMLILCVPPTGENGMEERFFPVKPDSMAGTKRSITEDVEEMSDSESATSHHTIGSENKRAKTAESPETESTPTGTVRRNSRRSQKCSASGTESSRISRVKKFLPELASPMTSAHKVDNWDVSPDTKNDAVNGDSANQSQSAESNDDEVVHIAGPPIEQMDVGSNESARALQTAEPHNDVPTVKKNVLAKIIPKPTQGEVFDTGNDDENEDEEIAGSLQICEDEEMNDRSDDGSNQSGTDDDDNVAEPTPSPMPAYMFNQHRLHHEVEAFASLEDVKKLKNALPRNFRQEEFREFDLAAIPISAVQVQPMLWFEEHTRKQLHTPQGPTDEIFATWLPPGVLPALQQLALKVGSFAEKERLSPENLMAQVPAGTPYYREPGGANIDALHKAGSQSYEHIPQLVDSTLSAPSNLFNPTLHMAAATQLLRGYWIDPTRSLPGYFLPFPTFRLVDSYAQICLVAGLPQEAIATRHYLFDVLMEYKRKGCPDEFFTQDSPDARERANQLWRIFTAPPTGKYLISLLRAQFLPYLVRRLTVIRIKTNPIYTISHSESELWPHQNSTITPLREAENLVTVTGENLRLAVANADHTKRVKPTLFCDMSLYEGEGTPAAIINRSDRPDLVQAPMRATGVFLNAYGEAVSNGYKIVIDGLEKIFAWETFGPAADSRSNSLTNDVVFCGAQAARELASLAGSSYVGSPKMHIKDVLLFVASQKAALWQKDGSRAKICLILPDDSLIYEDENIVEEPSQLDPLARDTAIIGCSHFVIHIAEFLRSVNIVPVFIEKLHRPMENGDSAWRRMEYLQRGSCSYYKTNLIETNQLVVDLQALLADCYTVPNYYGTTVEAVKYSIGCKAPVILTRIDNFLQTDRVTKFWTENEQRKLFKADAQNRRYPYRPFEFFREFTMVLTDVSKCKPNGGDAQLMLRYSGSPDKLAANAKAPGQFQKAWAKKWTFVRDITLSLSFQLNETSYDLPRGVKNTRWTTRLAQLSDPSDKGVKLADLYRQQTRMYQRGIEAIWTEGYSLLQLSGPTPQAHLNRRVRESKFDAIGQCEAIPIEYSDQTLAAMMKSAQDQWSEICQPPDPVPQDVIDSPVIIGADPMGSLIAKLLQKWLNLQDSRDPVRDTPAPLDMPLPLLKMYDGLVRFWQYRLNVVPTPDIKERLTSDTIRRTNRMGFYLEPTLLTSKTDDAGFRGFFTPIPGNLPVWDIIGSLQAPPRLPAIKAATPLEPTTKESDTRKEVVTTDKVKNANPTEAAVTVSPRVGTIPSSSSRNDLACRKVESTKQADTTRPGIRKLSLDSERSQHGSRCKQDMNRSRRSTRQSTCEVDCSRHERAKTQELHHRPSEPGLRTKATRNQPPEPVKRIDSRFDQAGNALAKIGVPDTICSESKRTCLSPAAANPGKKTMKAVSDVSTTLTRMWTIVQASELNFSYSDVESAVSGGQRLPYPLNAELTDLQLLLYCEPPETAEKMGDDYNIKVEDMLALDLPGPMMKWNLARARGMLVTWFTRKRRHVLGKMTITRPDMARILKQTEDTMKSLFPTREAELSASKSIECG